MSRGAPCPPSASVVEMNELLLPGHANALNTAFGGQIMAWVDICAAMAAQRHAREVVVTAAMDAVTFIAPIKVGQVVNLRGMVNATWRTSMEVGVRVESEDPLTGIRTHVLSAYLTFVTIDHEGRPIAVVPVVPETSVETLRYREALARRATRLQLAQERQRLQDAHDSDASPR